MKKTRMSIDDIHAMVGSLRKNVLNMRVTNIYDLAAMGATTTTTNNKTYILKLHQPPFPKVFLLLESGVRFHTSKYARDAGAKNALPSQFTMKLRKHLRGKRLVALSQLEGDRVVDLTFGNDELQCHLILELYASGNIILTDDKYTILSLLRTHKFDENVKMAVRQTYPVSVLDSSRGHGGGITSATDLMLAVERWFEEQQRRAAETTKSAKKLKPQTLKQLLLTKDATFGGLGPVIVEHCIVSAGLTPTLKIRSASEFKAIGVTELMRLVSELQNGWTLLEKLQTEQRTVITAEGEGAPTETTETAKKQGFIILAPKKHPSDPDQFEEFTPYLYAQHRSDDADGSRVRAFDTFDDAVDEYFSHYEAQVAEVARQNAKAAAESKLEKLRKNQKQQIDQLLEVQEQSFRHAQLIEANQQDVENVLLVVRSALASGMDWRGLEELVHFEQKNGNPVASLIHELDLAHNRVAILLCDGDEDEEEEEEDIKEQDKQAHVIWIDLSLSALANAREIYSKKKKAGEKVKKATEATTRAIEMAAKQTKKALEKQQMKRHTIYQRRKTLWFEKFHWFLSSEQYLVIAGKDAHQNELLVKRYLRKGDVYVHADLHGAATCIVRNRANPHAAANASDAERFPPIPVATLEQAGCMSVCRSNAWTNQVIAGAYWVHAEQVSKTAPAGEYLTTGSFMIRGKKNYINPSRLEMGLAIVFRLDESSIANHRVDTAEEPRVAVEEEAVAEEEEEHAPVTEETGETEETETSEALPEEVTTASHAEAAEQETIEPQTEEAPVDAPEEVVDDARDEAPVEAKGDSGGASRDGKKRLSAKQRRDLKKGKSIDADNAPVPSTNTTAKKASSAKSEKKSDNAAAAAAAAQSSSVRGKKGKLKKMKKKYADQDDEDRRVRMQALGHAIADADDGKSAAASEENANDSDDDEEDTTNEATRDVAVRDEAYIRQQREKKEKYLEQEEEEAEQLDFFDAFTGAPLPQDMLLHAMPMCAPYSSLLRYKYKVKLTPGSVKKGKAAKTALEYLLETNLREEKDLLTAQRRAHKPESTEAPGGETEEHGGVEHVLVQRELLRCVTENELVTCMVGPVKVSAPGLHGGKEKGGKGAKGGGKKKK